MVVVARARQCLQLGGQIDGGGSRSAAAGTKAQAQSTGPERSNGGSRAGLVAGTSVER